VKVIINHLIPKNGRESRTYTDTPLTETTIFERMPADAGASFYIIRQNSRKTLHAKAAGCLFFRTSSFSGGTTSKGRKNMWEDFFFS
jgi:hypothetical protein